jgi:hypothetical protein
MSTRLVVAGVSAILAAVCLSASLGPRPAAEAPPPSRPERNSPDTERLLEYAQDLHDRWNAGLTPLYYELINSTDPAQQVVNDDPNYQLMYIDPDGNPVYYALHNLNAAKTIGTNHVWPPPYGTSGHDVDGSTTAFNELAIWDNGKVRDTHVALSGKVLNGDGATSVSFHATHVAGTIVGRNDSLDMSGMSYEGRLTYYDFSQVFAELATAAATGLLVSNHSYGIATGWEPNYPGGGVVDWYWSGDTSIDTYEDYLFGFYLDHSQIVDSILYDAGVTTMVVSSGNDRNHDGPDPGQPHWVKDPVTKKWVQSYAPRMSPDGGGEGYDALGPYACAKNVITVGATDDLPAGWAGPGDVMVTQFSSFGPTDDGRVKPDVVANGDDVWSAWSYTDTSYINSSGTSHSAPSVAGSIDLLLRYWRRPDLRQRRRPDAGHRGLPDRGDGARIFLPRGDTQRAGQDHVRVDRSAGYAAGQGARPARPYAGGRHRREGAQPFPPRTTRGTVGVGPGRAPGSGAAGGQPVGQCRGDRHRRCGGRVVPDRSTGQGGNGWPARAGVLFVLDSSHAARPADGCRRR